MRTLILSALIALTAAPALAGPPIAVVSGTPGVYEWPQDKGRRLGTLVDGSKVELIRCESADYPSCQIKGGGWVDASFLVGSPAKQRVTEGYHITEND